MDRANTCRWPWGDSSECVTSSMGFGMSLSLSFWALVVLRQEVEHLPPIISESELKPILFKNSLNKVNITHKHTYMHWPLWLSFSMNLRQSPKFSFTNCPEHVLFQCFHPFSFQLHSWNKAGPLETLILPHHFLDSHVLNHSFHILNVLSALVTLLSTLYVFSHLILTIFLEASSIIISTLHMKRLRLKWLQEFAFGHITWERLSLDLTVD